MISVIIPTHNYARFLPDALASVLDQTVPAYEIIVGDDGSVDNTPELMSQFHGKVRYLRYPHSGVYTTRNRLLDEVRSPWLLNLDADNRLDRNFLARMEEVIRAEESDKNFAFAYPDMKLFGDREGEVRRPDLDVGRLKLGNYIDMNSVIRTDVARSVRFDSQFNGGQGDYDFFLTLVERGYRGLRAPGALLHYRVHDSSISERVSRRRKQRLIMRRILRKHYAFFSPEERRAAIAEADNRLLVALIGSRSPFAGLAHRLADWFRFMLAGPRHDEFRGQTRYCFRPQRYFARCDEPADVFYLFRDVPLRRKLVRLVHENPDKAVVSEQLFGYESLRSGGLKVNCNLRWPRVSSVSQIMLDWLDQVYSRRMGIGLGDLGSLWAHLEMYNRARVVLATTDNVGLAAARLKELRLLKRPLIYVSIGLPERIMEVERISPARAERYRRRLFAAERLVAYGYAEAEWLRRWLGDPEKVRFIPFGVDADIWRPLPDICETIDVLGVGNDIQRDFDMLIDYARRRPSLSFGLVTSPEWAASLGALPPNMKLDVALSVEALRARMASAKMLALPVKENTYSGATTTLLQGMAMAKACAVSRVGAIREGYGLEDGVNVCWLEPGSQSDFDARIDALLTQSEHLRGMGEAARQHVTDRLSWRRYVDDIHSCISELMSG